MTGSSVTPRWMDGHCHLPASAEGSTLIDEARAAGVERMITVGTDVESSREMLSLAATHEGVYATAGVHPHEARHGIEGLGELLNQGVVALGECGLDYHYDHSPREVQREVFAQQVAMAGEAGIPLMVHTRQAWQDTLAVLASEGVPARTVIHCFTGGPAEAQACLELGALLSFSGIVSFPKATEVRETAQMCPMDRLLIETDSPYLAPVPYRGKTNRPAWVPHVGAAVAELKGLSPAEVATTTWDNAEFFYGLGAPA